jgi:hypothetical protein
MRLLSRVCPYVYRQGTPLDETLAATGRAASVRSLVGVYPIVSLQVRLSVEALYEVTRRISSEPDLNGEIRPRERPRVTMIHEKNAYLPACLPIALERASHGLIINQLHQFHA